MSAAPKRRTINRPEVEALVGRMARQLEAEPTRPIACKVCGARRNVVRLPDFPEVPLCGRCLQSPPKRRRPARLVGDPLAADDLLINMAEAMKLAEEPIAYPIDPIAARGFLTVLAGRTGSLKTWVMTVSGHVAHRGGGEVAELRCEGTTVLYVDAENGPRLMGRRFKAAGIPSDGLLVADGTKLRLPRDLNRLRALIEGTRAGLVVLDSLRRLAPRIRENESDDMAAVIADLGTIARDLDTAVVLIHHRSTKAGAATLRGSSSIEDQADLVFTLERVAGDPDRERRRLKAVKYRIDAEPDPLWLRMGMVGGCFAVGAAEPYEGGGDAAGEEHGAEEQLAERIDALADQVRTDRGWPPRRLAAAVGRSQDDGTFKRALSLLLGRGTWKGTGKGKGRRLQPCDVSGQPGQPLGNGLIGPVEPGSDEAPLATPEPEVGGS